MLKKVAFKQHDIKDCGAACLYSVIKYYNGYIPMNKIREDTKITKNGISAYNIIYAANKYGFDAYGAKAYKSDLLNKELLLPCIAYLELSYGLKHYVVIYKINSKYLLIMDPAKGIIKMKMQEFLINWKNILIILSPRSNILKYEKNNELACVLFNVFKSEKKLIISLFITSFILTIFSIVSSFYLKVALEAVNADLINLFYFVIILFLAMTIIKVIFNYLKSYFENHLNKNIDIKILLPFIYHIFRLPSSAISNHTVGEISTRIGEINNIKDLFSNMFVSLVLNLLLAVCTCFVLFNISNKLFLCLLLIIFIYFTFNLFWIKSVNREIDESINCETIFNSHIISYLKAFNSIKHIHNYYYFDKNIEEKTIMFLRQNFKFNNFINICTFFNNCIIEIGLFLINSYGLYLIMKNNMNLINLITFNSLYLYLIDPVKQTINLIPKYFFIKQSFTKINEFIMLKEEKFGQSGDNFSNGDISFINTSFTYDNYNYPLKKFNINIQWKSKVLIMGKSGCGKSTIFKLIYRLYIQNEGEIKINNINIEDYDLDILRKNIAYLSQEECLFNDTIKNNILMDARVSLEYLNKIINICQVDQIIKNKALKMDSYILENGDNLSGGEKARIILARTLIKNAEIILLDEAFSEIEEDDANTIINDIMNYFKNKTIICISHFKPLYAFDKEIKLRYE